MTTNFSYKNLKNHPFYTEGPVMDDAGNWYFTNLAGGTITKIKKDGTESIWSRADCPNGQVILSNGQHLVCDSKSASIIRFDSEGTFISKIIDKYCSGELVYVPNDLIEDKKGTIYFTDSVRHEGKIGCISADGKEKIVAKGLDYPNGLSLSNDEKKLFVAESYKNRIIAFDINNEGELSTEHKVIAKLPCHPSNNITLNLPDGIKVDKENTIWVAHYGMGMIHRLSENGKILLSLNIPFKLVSNIFISSHMMLITGGYGEPGPGSTLEIAI